MKPRITSMMSGGMGRSDKDLMSGLGKWDYDWAVKNNLGDEFMQAYKSAPAGSTTRDVMLGILKDRPDLAGIYQNWHNEGKSYFRPNPAKIGNTPLGMVGPISTIRPQALEPAPAMNSPEYTRYAIRSSGLGRRMV
jgi:hypothetical protein